MEISLSNNYVLASMTAVFTAAAYKSFEQFNTLWDSLNCSSIADRLGYLSSIMKNPAEKPWYKPMDIIAAEFRVEEMKFTKCYIDTSPYQVTSVACAIFAFACLSYLTYKCCRR